MELDPGHANGQVALWIAALRDNDPDGAQGPLEKAVVLAPSNPFALSALGQLLLMQDNVPAVFPHLRAATTVAPEDPINLFTYAQCLLAMEGESHETEADELFKRALRLAPAGKLAEKIKNQQRRLAERVMRSNAQGVPRLDAVMYLSSALEAYSELDPEGQKQLLAEAGAVWQKGLSINNPEQNHHLKHFRGGTTVSALQVVCILYVGAAAPAGPRRKDRLRSRVRAGQGNGRGGSQWLSRRCEPPQLEMGSTRWCDVVSRHAALDRSD